MASLVPGYEYDIFISYRQKDNKYDGWVTTFVDDLKRELDTTFKDDISLYFDINPHDGLLETHDVDASLQEKLRCLVFIPIISKTYCDPRSFAWDHEFKAFVQKASNDGFGLKVRLSDGNIASRVLPVRIHDLNETDIAACETVLGGSLRGIDFIYKSFGVNRPLRINEDNPRENLNKTFYRDQINKVANAAGQVIEALRSSAFSEEKKTSLTGNHQGSMLKNKSQKRGKKLYQPLFLIILVVFIALIAIFVRNLDPVSHKKIAILPLRSFGNQDSLVRDGDNFIEVLNDKLKHVRKLSLVPSISMLQYRNTEKTPDLISKELGSEYLIDGNIRQKENKTIIWLELSEAKANKLLWSGSYICERDQMPAIAREIVRTIASRLKLELSPEEMKQVDMELTGNNAANMNYIAANVITNDAWFYSSYKSMPKDSVSFASAIASYDKAIALDTLFAKAYAGRSIATSWGFYTGQLDSDYIEKCRADIDKALRIDRDLPDAQTALGFYYYYCKNDLKNALIHFRNASELNRYDYQPLFYMSLVYRKTGDWKKTRELLSEIAGSHPTEALFLTNIGLSYTYLHEYDSALMYHQKAIDLMPGWSASYLNKILTLLLKSGTTEETWKLLSIAEKKTGEDLGDFGVLMHVYDRNYKDALREVMASDPGTNASKAEKYLDAAFLNSLMGNTSISMGFYKSSLDILIPEIQEHPRDNNYRRKAALAYAGLGNKVKALEEIEEAMRLSLDNNMLTSDTMIDLARIFTMTGDYGNAFETIKYLLDNPSMLSAKVLQSDPVWDPLKQFSEYKTLVKQYSKKKYSGTDKSEMLN
jgi:tetratricopeptide (TPR) repeat protein